jgi:membrane associated rhomboid family serine protease
MVLEALAALLMPQDYVAHWAHVGGFLFGMAWAFGRRDRRIKVKRR